MPAYSKRSKNARVPTPFGRNRAACSGRAGRRAFHPNQYVTVAGFGNLPRPAVVLRPRVGEVDRPRTLVEFLTQACEQRLVPVELVRPLRGVPA